MGDRIPVLLLGNKIDNETEREVPRGLGEQLAKVRGEHPVSLDGEGPRGGSGMCPRAGLGSFLGRPLGRKQAGRMVSWHRGRGGEGGVQLLCT